MKPEKIYYPAMQVVWESVYRVTLEGLPHRQGASSVDCRMQSMACLATWTLQTGCGDTSLQGGEQQGKLSVYAAETL